MADDGRPTAAPAGAILARCRYGPTTAAGWGAYAASGDGGIKFYARVTA